ncbi:exporters of the RND superfamily-like protein [Chloroherpeton thalassium ATCC 35110]|uniref:Exporters of the RND superfamily-like protein n=1 Tax=Chloroherpeton thalassium (strain ATCC 35110 / GB-78) TaxID=517418 RepID=B3QRW0_CHLT3|nr:outer membrane lipoprotein-sorting protein [Chloroherpeton thalassium]ACF13913.1 exporters of the RND superfamily-like protein [Chloroherpeton thalassium ATCC 35110]
MSGTESISTLTIIGKRGEQRVRKMAMVSKLYDDGLTEKKLVKFNAPADVKGTGFLWFDYNDKSDDKWIYMTALRKTRRIISSENAKSFMGSEFSYADMSLPTVDDFSYKFLQAETVNGESCYALEIIPKTNGVAEDNGFSKKISYISKNDFVLRKAIYYNLAGEKEKIMRVKSIIEVDANNHKFKMKEMEMENLLSNRKSISRIEQIKFNPNVPDDYFTTRHLEK